MTKYIDHLHEHAKHLASRYIQDNENLPGEFDTMEQSHLVRTLTDHITGILRKVEDDALMAAVASTSAMVRYAQNVKERGG